VIVFLRIQPPEDGGGGAKGRSPKVSLGRAIQKSKGSEWIKLEWMDGRPQVLEARIVKGQEGKEKKE